MFITTKLVVSMTTGEILERSGYEYEGPLALACDASKGEKSTAASSESFSTLMQNQAGMVFGDDNQVFTNMLKKYGSIVDAGQDQQGFSQAELNARNAAAITQSASQFRNVAAAVKSGQAGYGGGNTLPSSGATVSANAQIAEASAASTASELNKIQQENYETGRENFWQAAKGEEGLPSAAFSNIPGIAGATTEANKTAFGEQQQIAAANNWWQAPVMGLVGSMGKMATGGLLNLDTTGSSTPGEQVGNFFSGAVNS
jgi:hypothetical protein